MRIHRLAFGALGPYPGEHAIEFDALGDGGLFIIEGPTGAGKSTILDAIVFALYSDVAGQESDKQRLRSAFAAPDAESFAEVEFSSSSGLFRVRRTPEFSRPSRRGGGDTVAAPTVHLWRSTGEHSWESVSTRHREADAEILRAVGLDKGQFLQTVVLPQGEFARFLKANSAERQSILERVFATSIFARLQEWADEQRRDAERRMAACAVQVRDSVQQLSGRIRDVGLDAELEELVAANGGGDDSGLVVAMSAIRAAAAAAALKAVGAAATAAGQVNDLAAVLEGLRAWHHAGEGVAGARAALSRAAARVEAADLAAAAQVADLSSLIGGSVRVDDPDLLLTEVDEAIGSLIEVARQAADRPALAAEVERLERSSAADDTTFARLETERDVELPGLMLWCAEEFGRQARVLDAAHADADSARDHLVQARFDGMAGELARDLSTDTECPVCGSLDHPRPAKPAAVTVAPADIDSAGRRVESLARERLAMAPHLATARGLAERVADGVVGPVPPEQGDDDPLDVLISIQGRLRSIADELPEVGQRATASRVLVAEKRAQIVSIDAILSAATGGFATVDARIARVRQARVDIVAVREARADQAQAARALATAEALLAAIDEPEQPDTVGALEAELLELKRRSVSAASTADGALTLGKDVEALCGSIDEARAARDQVSAQCAAAVSVADVLNGRGRNQLMQPLKAYVLQQMFDEVIVAANRRLTGMLDGRFALVDTEQAQGRERQLGLGLAIIDRFTDSTRRADTLSGGETFCTSLALALGLADTVRAHAGGIDIGMLFVDEGFGSLDADRLDDVMAELLRLRADGRTVGVISHVSEMKRSIPERISVRPLGHGAGSTLSVTWMGD